MDKNDKWHDAYYITCIKKYKTLNVGSSYKVNGRGSLEYNHAPEIEGRTGFGLNITQDKWASKGGNIHYYFTIDELNEYFCTDEEDANVYIRDSKIKDILG